MREGNIFSPFTLVGGGGTPSCRRWGEGTPSQVCIGGYPIWLVKGRVPHPAEGVPHPRSGWGVPWGKPPRTGWSNPLPGLDGVTPPSRPGMGYPPVQDWMGCPPVQDWIPPPPVRRQISIASTCYVVGGLSCLSLDQGYCLRVSGRYPDLTSLPTRPRVRKARCPTPRSPEGQCREDQKKDESGRRSCPLHLTSSDQ